jgi:biopolymer transport protein ExbB/TolQ
MESFGPFVSDALRTIVGACQTPIVVIVLVLGFFTLCLLGSLIVEAITEHRHFKVFLPSLVDSLMAPGADLVDVIKRSGLLMRQKQLLIELAAHENITPVMRESLAVGLRYREQKRFDNTVKITSVITIVGPMLGLLGTLIPLGPGIMALGVGDTATLSSSLLNAFDTTSMGLMMAGISVLITAVRSRWYKTYMVSFDAAIEWELEILAGAAGTPQPSASERTHGSEREGR